ncbi:MAG: hypothetical protein Kow0013_02370 [Pararhodobacter sp.]
MTEPIIKTIDVPCSAQRAFDTFVHRISDWWPLDGHAVSAATGKAALGVTIEPRVGGRVYETMHDGQQTDWGKVLTYAEGEAFSMTWHPGNNADNATHVAVRFEALDHSRTRVTLTHSGWEIWATEADAKRDSYNSGWDFVLGQRYAGACTQAPA